MTGRERDLIDYRAGILRSPEYVSYVSCMYRACILHVSLRKDTSHDEKASGPNDFEILKAERRLSRLELTELVLIARPQLLR